MDHNRTKTKPKLPVYFGVSCKWLTRTSWRVFCSLIQYWAFQRVKTGRSFPSLLLSSQSLLGLPMPTPSSHTHSRFAENVDFQFQRRHAKARSRLARFHVGGYEYRQRDWNDRRLGRWKFVSPRLISKCSLAAQMHPPRLPTRNSFNLKGAEADNDLPSCEPWIRPKAVGKGGARRVIPPKRTNQESDRRQIQG